MTKLFWYLGLPEHGPDVMYRKAVNVNMHKGENAVIDHKAGLGRTLPHMLPASREFIRSQIHFDELKSELSYATGVLFNWQ